MKPLTCEDLRTFNLHGVDLRQRSNEEEAFKYYKGCFGRIRDEGILEKTPSDREGVELYALACEVVLGYAATCTQHSFRTRDKTWHETAVGIEEDVLELSGTVIPSVRAAGLDPKPIEREIHRAGNSLGVSYQRPRSLFPGRNTKKAVNLTTDAANYYREKALDIIARTEGNCCGQDKEDVLNAVRYCGNNAAAYYQRAEDYAQAGDKEKALRCYSKSEEIRREIERSLIIPVFGEDSLKYCQSLSLRAGTCQAMARVQENGELAERLYEKAQGIYDEAIAKLSYLEETNGSEASDGGCVTYQNARLGAQYGQAWCLFNMGRYAEALELHRSVYIQRRELLGTDHVDTIKSLDAVNKTISNIE